MKGRVNKMLNKDEVVMQLIEVLLDPNILNKLNDYKVKALLNDNSYSLYTGFINKYNENKTLESNELDLLKTFLQVLDAIYISGAKSPLTDPEYDDIHSIYFELSGGQHISNKLPTGSNKVKHLFPNLKGTLDKVHFISEKSRIEKSRVKTHKSLEKWLRDILEKLPSGKYRLGLYFKYDGVSIIFAIKNGKVISAISRGDSDTGEGVDKTHLFKDLHFDMFMKLDGIVGLKTEIVMGKENFEKFDKKFGDPTKPFSDPRSAVSGVTNTDEFNSAWLKYLTIVNLMIEQDGIFSVPEEYPDNVKPIILTIDKNFNIEKLENEINKMIKMIGKSDINCDGIVVRFIDDFAVNTLGRDHNRCVNKFEVAYKFTSEETKSILKSIEFSVGNLGRVSAVAKIEPVNMKSRTIKSINLNSIDRFLNLNLSLGDEVIVKYDIIPYLDRDNTCRKSNNKPVELIEYCPRCGKPLAYNPELMCINPDCSSRIIGKVINYCEKMNIMGIGEGIIETFFNHGFINSIEDLYRLKEHRSELIELDGYGKKSIDLILKAINDNRTSYDYNLLGSIGIPGVGRRIFKKLLLYRTFGEIMSDDLNLTGIPGIGDKMSIKIKEGISSNKDTIHFLLKEVKLIKENGVSNKSIVFSKVRNKAFEKHLEKLGYSISDTVNKDTEYLIVDSLDSKSSKITKAIKNGVEVISISKAYNKFEFL